VGPKRHILFEIENKVINFSEFVNPYSEFEQNWGLQIGPALFEIGTFLEPLTIVECWKSLVQNPGFCPGPK
jgi:hypothetical protein